MRFLLFHFIVFRDRKYTIRFECNYSRVTTASPRVFHTECMQQPNTIIQPYHVASSTKGQSRSSKNQLAGQPLSENSNNRISSRRYARKQNQRNKESTTRPLHVNDRCPFHFVVFLATDDYWYLSTMRKGYNNECCFHEFHFPSYHPTVRKSDLTQEELDFISSSNRASLPVPSIRRLMQEQFDMHIDDHVLRRILNDNSTDLLLQISDDLSRNPGTEPLGPAQRLIRSFSMMEDVSYVYITHTLNSGFVTHRKKRKDSKQSNSFSNTEADNLSIVEEPQTERRTLSYEQAGVTEMAMSAWRNDLRINSNEILVAFAFIHDEDLRLTRMFPEYIAADLTFGTNSQQRSLFISAGVDGNGKVFTSLRCFMPSQQLKAFQWIFNIAFASLIGEETMKNIHLFTSDQEYNLVQSVKSLTIPKGLLETAVHRYDKYHIFIKEWRNYVVHNPLTTTIYKWLDSFFDDIETHEEYNMSLQLLRSHLDSQIVKDGISLKSYSSIREILDTIETNITNVGSHYFTKRTTFGYKGDSIVESCNAVLKNSSIKVDGRNNLDVSACTQMKAIKEKSEKRTRYFHEFIVL
jgi:hypothetical protein